MARFREIYAYPYAGWWEKPWSTAKEVTDAVRDLDAAARSARRVTESVSQALRELGVEAYRGQVMLTLRIVDGEQNSLDLVDKPSDMSFGFLGLPTGIHRLPPAERVLLLGEPVIEAAQALGRLSGWDADAVDQAMEAVRDGGFRARAEGPWKTTRDGRKRVRLRGEIADDGYLRMAAEIDDLTAEAAPRLSEEIVGWTWLENVARAAKGMRFLDSGTLWFGSGSETEFETVVDLDTGAATRTPRNPAPLSYPGG